MGRRRLWLLVHLGLGLAWVGLLASRAPGPSGPGASGPQVVLMLGVAGWLPSLALAGWQVNHRQWRSLLLSDLLAAGLLVLLRACGASWGGRPCQGEGCPLSPALTAPPSPW